MLNRVSEQRFVARLSEDDSLVNLYGNYDYLSRAYYTSLDFENEDKPIRPSCKEMLDAYIPPLFLEKAQSAGIAIPEYYISNGYFEPPVIVDPINPFTLKGKIVLKPGRVKTISRSLTRNFTYAVCCQELPPESQVAYFRSVLGWSTRTECYDMARVIWEFFGIPLARVRVIKMKDGSCLLSDISPLFFEDMRLRELHYIEDRVTWDN